MKRIFIVLVLVVAAVCVAAPDAVRGLYERVRGGEAQTPVAEAMEAEFENFTGPTEGESMEPPAENYAPGSVQHDWETALADNSILSDGSVARLPALEGADDVELSERASGHDHLPDLAQPPTLESPRPNGLPSLEAKVTPLPAQSEFPVPSPPPSEFATSDEFPAPALGDEPPSHVELLPALPPPELPLVNALENLPTDPSEIRRERTNAPSNLPVDLPSDSPIDLPSDSPRDGLNGAPIPNPPVATPVEDTAPRRPPVPFPKQPVGTELDAPAESLQDANVVLFARELVELKVWENWHVTEAAAGRDVRLVVSLTEYKDKLEQGMWLSCHVIRSPTNPSELERLLMDRIAAVTRQRASLITTRAAQVGPYAGVRGDFVVETKPIVVRGKAEPRKYDGFHVLVPTPWALVEVHGVSPVDDKAGLQKLEQVLGTLQLRAPKPWPHDATPQTVDAQNAFGVWKSSQGRMRIFPSGRIDLESDRVLLLSTPATQQEAERLEAEGPPRLRGVYQATDDLIRITWNDGSRLNLRWKLSKGKLLVTDHRGQISKLKPLLE